ncbi:hypothetical protein CcCBS67573_g04707 [Chytriomyces confervae]|uniref:Late embryogenesis abundant protein LEA-2 subgroup domain-containing protein n=1 Tax=Chytriomyces confervae TaxID=246404 RepID=A0A507FFG2_9FUNG|nr:hypothetical protein HDU80_003127 [Chytriomyces hyalinus]TPX74026.1 hypothetical protein CcCBS67573_g04707 [Chytriomyces confervae]
MTTQPTTFKSRVRNHGCLRGPRLYIWITLLTALVLTVAFLAPRKPGFDVVAVNLNTQNLADLFPLQISSATTASVFLILTLNVHNTNFYSITVENMSFKATNAMYDQGNSAFASASNTPTFTLPMRGSTTLAIPFAIQYNASKDAGFKFARMATSSCAINAFSGSGDGFPADIDLNMSVNVLGIRGIWIQYFQQQVVKCPLI